MNGSTWRDSGKTAVTNSLGQFGFTVSPSSKTWYRVRFGGCDGFLPSTSGNVSYTPRAYLTSPASASTVLKNVKFPISGYLKPRHASGGRDVVLCCYRYESGRWVLRKTFYAYDYNHSSYTKYLYNAWLPAAGSWKVLAYHRDAGHAATWAGPKYITVK